MVGENELIKKTIVLSRIALSEKEKKRILKDIGDIEKLFSNLDSCKIRESEDVGLQRVAFSSLREDFAVKDEKFDLLNEAKEREGEFVKGARV